MAPKKGKRPYVGPNAGRLRAAAGLTAARDFSYPNLSPLFGQGKSSLTTAPLSLSNCHLTVNHVGFSMRDEAKNTMSHQSTWGQDARLRKKPVAFVSTGFTEPLKDLEVDEESDVIMAEKSASEPDIDAEKACLRNTATEPHLTSVQPVEASVEVEIGQETLTLALEIPGEAEEPVLVDNGGRGSPTGPNDSPCDVTPGFFFDLDGDKSLQQARSPVIIPTRASSPARSDSSEEVILFRGRSGQTQRSTPQRIEPTDKPANPPKSEPHHECLGPGSSSAHAGRNTGTFKSRRKRSSSAHHAMQSRRAPEDEEDDNEEDQILADYIANMAAQSDDGMIPQLLKSFNNRRDLGGEDDAFDFGSENGDEGGPGRRKRVTNDDSDEASGSGNDDDRDDAAGDTSDDDMPSGLNDESLAQLLAKQEELGMGADELMLYSEAFAKMRSQSGSGGGNGSSKKAPLNAGAVADALDNLDLTDWNQGEFRKPGRARRSKQPPAFNVSDSELDMALKTAWLTDRERKKNRKMERELLRSQGLLGKNVNPDDLRVKYQSHMTLDDIKSELAAFLVDSAET